MVGYHFSDHARAVLQAAQATSKHFRHPRVGTEHLLLAIASNPDPRTAAGLARLRLDPGQLVEAIEQIVHPGTTAGSEDREMAPRLMKALELAVAEAMADPSANGVDTPHLVLGLLQEGKGIGAQVLQDAGVSLQAARQALFPPQ